MGSEMCIRDSPKVQNASELMSGCPAEVEDKSLAELAIKVALPQE